MSGGILGEVSRHLKGDELVLDPFGGTGRTHLIAVPTVCVELEWEWTVLSHELALQERHRNALPGVSPQPVATVAGDALHLPFRDRSFDAIVTSPTYGNRYADHHVARDGSKRRSYQHDLGRPLSPSNSGALQWGTAYQEFHRAAWTEACRVLKPNGVFVLNCKDHVRRGTRQFVTDWHVGCLESLGLAVTSRSKVPSRGLRMGRSSARRVDFEEVVVLRRPRPTDGPKHD